MKALLLTPGTNHVRLATDWQEPKLETPTQIKVRILEVGICGTDREEASGGRADAPKGEKELVIGHEMLGSVVEIGAKVTGVKKNDLVVLTVRRGCGACANCKAHCSDMCETGNYTERGIKQRHGYQTEFVVEEQYYAILVPPGLKQLAVLTEPTTVVEKAIDHACRIQRARLPLQSDWLPHKKVLVAGLGPIGLLAAMVLRLRGAEVFGLDIVDPESIRPKILEALGGTYLRSVDTAGRFDLILDAAGVAKLDFELMDSLAANGVYVLTGVPGKGDEISVKGSKLMRQFVLENQVLLGSVNAGHIHFEKAVADLEAARKKWPGEIEKLITSRTPCAQFQNVLFKHPQGEIKAVITW